tara:strand:+ start:283 stop:540 length:258 start_codon:yes stop_codon:yes gene_type:complete
MNKETTVQLNTDDLTALKQIQSASKDLLAELGQIKLIELSIEKRIENAKNYQVQLNEKETLVGKLLQEKYGRGSVDLETGTFIPA